MEVRLMFQKCANHRLSQRKIEERQAQKAVFPNKSSAGSFTPLSTIVEILDFRTNEVNVAIENGNLLPVRKDLQVIAHELTHWFDFFGTLWGRYYCHSIARAFLSLERHNEEEFSNIVALFDLGRRILSPSYYRYTSKPKGIHNTKLRWTIDFASGAEIDPYGHLDERKPLFLVRFGEHSSRDNFARQPISIGTLLEVRAVASEINIALEAINTSRNEDERIVETTHLTREFEDIVYNYKYIEYNTAAHTLSHFAHVQDIILAYRLAASIAYIALNMSEDDFKILKIPKEFDIFGKRNRAFIKNHDRGFAFVCMITNGGPYLGDENTYISNCIKNSNLGNAETIISKAIILLSSPIRLSKSNITIDHFIREAAKGKEICEALSSQKSSLINLELIFKKLRRILPPLMDSNGAFIELSPGRAEEYQPEKMHDAAHELNSYTQNLLSGCRGLN